MFQASFHRVPGRLTAVPLWLAVLLGAGMLGTGCGPSRTSPTAGPTAEGAAPADPSERGSEPKSATWFGVSDRPPSPETLQAWNRDFPSPPAASFVGIIGRDSPVHGIRPASLLFSPDGRWLASGMNSILLRDPATGAPVRQLGLNSGCNALLFSADSGLLISAVSFGKIEIIPLKEGAIPQVVSTGFRGISALALSPDGATLAAMGIQGEITLWKLSDRSKLRDISGADDVEVPPLTDTLHFTSDGAHLVSAVNSGPPNMRKGLVRVHQTADGVLAHSWSPNAGPITAFAVHPQREGVVTLGSQAPFGPQRLQFHTLAGESSGAEIPLMGGTRLALNAAGSQLAVTSAMPSALLVIDVERRAIVERRAATAWGGLHAVAFSPDGALIATGSAQGLVEMLETQGLQRIDWDPGHRHYVKHFSLSADGQRILSAGDDGTVREWTAARPAQGRIVTRGPARVDWLAWTGPEKYVALQWEPADGQQERPVFASYDSAGRQELSIPLQGVWPVVPALLSHAGDKLVYAAASGVALLDARTGAQLDSFPEHAAHQIRSPDHLAFDRDDRRVAALMVGNPERKLKVWDLTTRMELASFEVPTAFCVAFSPDERFVTCGTQDGISEWDLATGERTRSFTAAGVHVVKGLRYTRDGSTLVAQSGDGAISFWDVAGGTAREVVQARLGAEVRFELDPTEQYVVAAGSSPVMFLFRIPPGRPAAE